MKRPKSVALVGGGNFSSSSLARFWSLSEKLGPVKASSFRLASRIANALRAGYPVKDFAEFNTCTVVLISVPDRSLLEVIAQLGSAGISWRGKSVILCSECRGSCDLRELAVRGAATASLTAIPGFHNSRFLLEGDRRAVQHAKHLIETREVHSVTIEGGLKPLYLAALTCTTSLLFPLIMVATEALRRANVPAAASKSILEKQILNCLRSYARGGKRAYEPPQELFTQLHALSARDPRFAHYVEQSSRLAEQVLHRDAIGRKNVAHALAHAASPLIGTRS